MPASAKPRSCSRGCGRRNYEPVAAFGKIRAGAASRAGGRERLPAPPEVPWTQGIAGRVAAVFGGALSRPVYAAEVLLGWRAVAICYATLRDLGPLPFAAGTKRISIRLPNASAMRRNIASECPS